MKRCLNWMKSWQLLSGKLEDSMVNHYVKNGKYDVAFDESWLVNIIEKSLVSDERMVQIKKKLDHQSGEFIDSLSEFVTNYTTINQMVAINDFPLYQFEHTRNFVQFVEDQYENVPYTLKYHIIIIDKKK